MEAICATRHGAVSSFLNESDLFCHQNFNQFSANRNTNFKSLKATSTSNKHNVTVTAAMQRTRETRAGRNKM